jgi:hypothetical protein
MVKQAETAHAHKPTSTKTEKIKLCTPLTTERAGKMLKVQPVTFWLKIPVFVRYLAR